jgi:hypothetical protein
MAHGRFFHARHGAQTSDLSERCQAASGRELSYQLSASSYKLFEIYDREQGLQSEPNWEPPKPFTDTAVSDVNGVQYPLNTKHIPEEQYSELRNEERCKGRDGHGPKSYVLLRTLGDFSQTLSAPLGKSLGFRISAMNYKVA